MVDTMPNTITARKPGFYTQSIELAPEDEDLAPYASLFLKPLTNKKCAFSKHDLEMMCQDPLHSPRLILYLIHFFKHM